MFFFRLVKGDVICSCAYNNFLKAAHNMEHPLAKVMLVLGWKREELEKKEKEEEEIKKEIEEERTEQVTDAIKVIHTTMRRVNAAREKGEESEHDPDMWFEGTPSESGMKSILGDQQFDNMRRILFPESDRHVRLKVHEKKKQKVLTRVRHGVVEV